MKVVKYLYNRNVVSGLEVSANELNEIQSKCDYVDTKNSSIENKIGDGNIGVIFGDYQNIIIDLGIEDIVIEYDKSDSPICEFVDKEILVNNFFKPLNSIFSFSEAIDLLKLGYRVARKGWNGKNSFLFLSPKSWIEAIEEIKWSDYDIEPFICMKTAGNTIQPGWLASQADLLATDYVVIE
jgi:hypothetical protein